MGDVALITPAFKALKEQHPNVKIVFLTRPFYLNFFEASDNLILEGIDLSNYKGFLGLRKLYKEINSKYQIDLVCDLHDVLRSNVLNTFARMSGKKVFKIQKDRSLKKQMIKTKEVSKPLTHAINRYASVFNQAGFPLTIGKAPFILPKASIIAYLESNNLLQKETKWIGIAPFAMHETKILGLDKIEELIVRLLPDYKIFLFGGGKEELKKLAYLASKHEIYNASSELNFQEEMSLMTKLDYMVTMDSSNMHTASLLGVKTISIWGATHPSLGFAPFGNESLIVKDETLSCNPCSVFGNKPCEREDHACMKLINLNQIIAKIE